MLKLFQYMFYRLYVYQLTMWKDSEIAQYYAMFGVSFMMATNFLFLLMIPLFFGLEIIGWNVLKWGAACVLVLLFLINHFWLIRGRRGLKLSKEYEAETLSQRRRRSFWLWSYVVVSCLAPIAAALVPRWLYGPG